MRSIRKKNVQLIYLSKWFPGNCPSIGRYAIIVYRRKNGSGWQCLHRNCWQIHFLLFIISSLYRYNRFSIFRFISPRSIFRSIVDVLFLSKNLVFVLYHTDETAVCVFFFFYPDSQFSILSFFVYLASYLNIATFVFICVFACHAFACRFRAFSIYFPLYLCMLFALLNFVDFVYLASLCVHIVCIFIVFVVFPLSFSLFSLISFHRFSFFFILFSLRPSCIHTNTRLCVCFFLLRAVRFFCFSILYFNCTKQKYLYFCRLFCYFIGKRTGAASLNGLSLIRILYVFLLIVLDSFYHSTSSLSTSL